MTTTHITISREAAEAIKAVDGIRRSTHKFAASNGVNYTDESWDLPSGEHLELACISPQSWTCRYEWDLYSVDGAIAERFRPMAIGFHQGRYSDYLVHVLGRYEACKAVSLSAARLWTFAFTNGRVPSQKDIEDQRERGRINRGEAATAR